MSDMLINRERIRGASRMIPEGTDASAVTKEQIGQTAIDLEIFIKAHGISRKALATAVGYSTGVVSDFLNGKYESGNIGQVAIDLESWLVEEEARRSRPQKTQFVWTEVAKQIKGVASYCLDYRKIGLIYGPDTAGIGKTLALQAIHQELGIRRSTLVTIDKVNASAAEMLRKICQAMRLPDSGGQGKLFRNIVTDLKGRSHLLLIDQIHNLRHTRNDRTFYVLTDLYDATTTAQLWCGTSDLVNYFNGQRNRTADESLAQIRRRVFPVVDLMLRVRPEKDGGNGEPLVTIDQIREMFARNKLKLTHTAARYLQALAHVPDGGALGLCDQIVEYATVEAVMDGRASIDVDLLKVAIRLSMRPTDASRIMADVDAIQARLSKVG